MQDMIKKAAAHKGIAFIEIFQNCNIFNDGAFEVLTDKATKEDNVIVLEHGQPMIFGKEKNKGIKLDGFTPVIVDLTDGKHTTEDLLVHNEEDESPARAFILSHMADNEGFPTPVGIFRRVVKPTYDEGVQAQVDHVTEKKGKGSLEQLLKGKNTWEVN